MKQVGTVTVKNTGSLEMGEARAIVSKSEELNATHWQPISRTEIGLFAEVEGDYTHQCGHCKTQYLKPPDPAECVSCGSKDISRLQPKAA